MSQKTEIKQIPDKLVTQNRIKQLQKHQVIIKAADLLKQGEVVAFPTETVYGLGADAGNSQAVKKIFKAKGRPQDNPLIVHIGDKRKLESIVKGEIPERAQKLIDAYWPGPLTLVLPKNKNIPDRTTAGLDTVAVRMPSHPVALALVNLSGIPLAAPSANSSGYPSPTRAEHVYHDLKSKIPYIIDGGVCTVGVESTVVDIMNHPPQILRPGGITRKEINNVLGIKIKDNTSNNSTETPKAPGMKYRHYSPVTPLKLIKQVSLNNINEMKINFQNKNVAVVSTKETGVKLKPTNNYDIFTMGSKANLEEIAHNLFAILRKLDKKDYDLILVEIIPSHGLGEAIMNRLHKAAVDDIYF